MKPTRTKRLAKAKRKQAAKPALLETPVKPAPRAWKTRLAGVLRVGAYAMVATTLVGFATVRSVWGDVEKSALSLGGELGRLGELGPERAVRINGESIFVSSSVEAEPVEAVLDKMESFCKKSLSGMAADIEAMKAELQGKGIAADTDLTAGLGIVREESRGRGVVACFVPPENELVKKSLAERATEFASSGDLGKLGRLRYLYAETRPSGKTHLVRAWTDGAFKILDLFGHEGDAPGNDPIGIPRPAKSTRLLSAGIDGAPYGVHLYETTGTPRDTLDGYSAAVTAAGWRPTVPAERGGDEVRAWSKSGLDLLATASEQDGRTVVSLIEMRSE